MKKVLIALSLIVLSTQFSGCNPSDGDSSGSGQNDDTFAHNFGSEKMRDFIGQVVDKDNHPVQNATVAIGSSTVQTDVNGVFIINGATVHEKFAYITAKKSGYIDGSRAMVPTLGKNNVTIMLLPNAPVNTVQSGIASEVALPNGTKVNFDGAFKDENGAAYTGTVSVTMFHLETSNTNINKLMPGMLYAQDKDNQAAVLETFGMLNVALRGSGGQKLNLADGHTAEITMKIDDSQLATAPASIPLWHFDEEKGYWKEDGTATKVGNNYVGAVSHFSWWNFDIPVTGFNITVTVVNSSGAPLSNTQVIFTTDENEFSSFTDTNGQIAGMLPANVPITMEVHGACGLLHTSGIGPLTSDTVLPDIVIDSAVAQSNVVSGSLLKCNSTAVASGYVLMNYGTETKYISVTNGTFSFTALECSSNNNFTLQGFDYESLQTTGTINFSFQPGQTNVGALSACNATDEFITFALENGTQQAIFSHFHSEELAFPYLRHFLYGNFLQDTYPRIIIRTKEILPGTYTITDDESTTNATVQLTFVENGILNIGPLGEGSTVVINNYGAIGEYIDMTFNGTFLNHTVTGTVHIKRDN